MTIATTDKTQTHRYRVIVLDVWGHAPHEDGNADCPGGDRCDGYTVNDAHYTRHTIEVTAKEHVYQGVSIGTSSFYLADDAEFVRVLVADGLLTPDCTAESIEVEDPSDGDLLYVNRKEDGKPLIQLQRVPS